MKCFACQVRGAVKGRVVCAGCLRYAQGAKFCKAEIRIPAKLLVVESGCWEWEGWINPKTLYPGGVLVEGRRVPPYRWVLQQKTPQPEGMETDHICFNRKCCNPDHLQWLSRSENVKRRKTGLKTPEERQAVRREAVRRWHQRNPGKNAEWCRAAYYRRKKRLALAP